MNSSSARLVATLAFVLFCFGVIAAQAPRLRVGGDLKAPEKLVHVVPVYPEEAKADKIAGIVILETVIATDGTVIDAKVIKSVHALLDESALNAARQWIYAPTQVDGEPVELIMAIAITFAAQK